LAPSRAGPIIFDESLPLILDTIIAHELQGSCYLVKSECNSDVNDETKRYFKLGEILAKTENLASNLSQLDFPLKGFESGKRLLDDEEIDPLSTYYYLGKVSAGIPRHFSCRKRVNHH
jgi:hypothetical protein